MTWHSSFVLEFENALLAVDPEVLAVPYWDPTVTSPSIFGEAYVGSVPGTGEGSTLIDGMFKNWAVVSNFQLSEYTDAAGDPIDSTFAGNEDKWLRKSSSTNNNPVLVTSHVDQTSSRLSIPCTCC
jgi:hypothetical protein